MGLAARLRSVDLPDGVEKDTEFLAVNPGGFDGFYGTSAVATSRADLL
jgi:hypothetical protein